jgi:hypothetical protein
MADNSGLFGLMGNDSNITAANILRSRARQPLYQAAVENADTGSIRATPPTKFESWLNESGQRLMNPTDTIAQGVQNFTQQDPVDMGMSLMGGALGTIITTQTAGELAQKLAHDRAMLPVSEHGLGLPAGNTAMDRANVMFPKDVYHSTDADILNINPSAGGKLGPGVYTSDSPDYVNKYISPNAYLRNTSRANPQFTGESLQDTYITGGNVMPLRIKDNLASPDTAELARQDTSHLGTPTDVKNYKTYWKQQVNDELANRGYSGRTIDGPIYDGMENVTFNPHDVRSRFAAFDPWRRNAAIAALTGTAAPDLMAGENDKLVNALRSK